MSKILDNPKEYFDSLSSEQFDDLLNEFKFNYKKIDELPDVVSSVKKYSEIISAQFFNNDVFLMNPKNIKIPSFIECKYSTDYFGDVYNKGIGNVYKALSEKFNQFNIEFKGKNNAHVFLNDNVIENQYIGTEIDSKAA